MFKDKLKSILIERNVTQKELANYLDVKQNTVSDWVNKGNSPKIEHLYRISDYLDVSLDWLLSDEGEPSQESPSDDEALKYRKMKIYIEAVSAGTGNYLFGTDAYEIFSFKSAEIPTKAEFGLRVAGDSMEPEIADSSIVWVKPEFMLEDGDTGVFILNGESLCKRLRLDRENRIAQLVSVNPKYPPINIGPDDPFFIVGRVLK